MTSIRHHYIPVFYTRRWAINNGKLCEYSRPHNHVVRPKRVAPAGTGFVERLYELNGFAPELAQQIEERFFAPVDNAAAQALDVMERDGNKAVWNSRLRSGWSRFIVSLLLRCPEDMEVFRQGYLRELQSASAEEEAQYQKTRGAGDPATFVEYMKGQPAAWTEMALFDAFMPLIDNKKIGEHINSMFWRVFDIPPSERELMTSDRPVIRTNGLDRPESHIAVPIGPRKLFVAAKTTEIIRRAYEMRPRELVADLNAMIVGGAANYAYSTNDGNLRYVQNRMSKQPQPRLMESLIKRMDDRAAARTKDVA